MKVTKQWLCGLIIVFCCFSNVFANGNTETSAFDIDKATRQLDEINITLSTQNLELTSLKNAVDTLEGLHDDAAECVAKANTALTQLDKKTIPTEGVSQTEYSRYIEEKKQQLLTTASQCRLFSLRSEEYISALKATMQKLSTTELLSQQKPVWQLMTSVDMNDVTLPSDILAATGLSSLNLLQTMLLLATVAFSLLIAYLIRGQLAIRKPNAPPSLSGAIDIIAKEIYPVLVTLGLSACLTLMHVGSQQILGILFIAYIASAYTLTRITFHLVFSYLSSKHESDVARIKLSNRFTWLLNTTTVSVLIYLTFIYAKPPTDFTTLAMIVAMTPVLIAGLAFLRALVGLFKLDEKQYALHVLLKLTLLIYFLVLIGTLWLGFHSITYYLVKNTVLTVLSLTLVSLVATMLIRFTDNLNLNRGQMLQSFRRSLDIKAHHRVPELFIFKSAIYLTAFSASIIVLLGIWAPTAQQSDYAYSLIKGFSVSGIDIYPVRIVTAMALFVVIMGLGRLIAGRVARQHRITEEIDTQVAMASIMRYLTFGIALIISFLIAGINMTGLAIIAGALSVGIGLGLQGIVNNFVSGLILLIEKPIQSGDRIIIGNTEGFVKKVRVRSTQITTLAKEDVIVPNSELINQQVVNYMFRDKYWRVICPVGIAYGSDVQLALQSLLEVADAHPDVLKEGVNKPTAYFKGFGESSLNFELWCIINDVNRKHPISSELHIAINNIFRERNIVIAFPQRDLHLKSWETAKPADPTIEK